MINHKTNVSNNAIMVMQVIVFLLSLLPVFSCASQPAEDVNGLIQKLKDKDVNIRWDAVNALGKIGAPAVEPLIAALRDEHLNTRINAAKALVSDKLL
jgi:hypothetical protein